MQQTLSPREEIGQSRLCRLMCGGGCAPPQRNFKWGSAPNLGVAPK